MPLFASPHAGSHLDEHAAACAAHCVPESALLSSPLDLLILDNGLHRGNAPLHRDLFLHRPTRLSDLMDRNTSPQPSQHGLQELYPYTCTPERRYPPDGLVSTSLPATTISPTRPVALADEVAIYLAATAPLAGLGCDAVFGDDSSPTPTCESGHQTVPVSGSLDARSCLPLPSFAAASFSQNDSCVSHGEYILTVLAAPSPAPSEKNARSCLAHVGDQLAKRSTSWKVGRPRGRGKIERFFRSV